MNGQNLVKMAILCLRRMHAMLKIGKMGGFWEEKSIFCLNLFIRFIWIVLDGSYYKKGKNDCLSFYEKFVICSK